MDVGLWICDVNLKVVEVGIGVLSCILHVSLLIVSILLDVLHCFRQVKDWEGVTNVSISHHVVNHEHVLFFIIERRSLETCFYSWIWTTERDAKNHEVVFVFFFPGKNFEFIGIFVEVSSRYNVVSCEFDLLFAVDSFRLDLASRFEQPNLELQLGSIDLIDLILGVSSKGAFVE